VGQLKDFFRKFSAKISTATGSPLTFILACSIVVAWALTGPFFDFSNTWQLVINTGTTIVTFLMVFLIQNTQNRDSKAMQLKLDELIRASKTARDSFVDLEDMTDEELDSLDQDFKKLKAKQITSAVMVKMHTKIARLKKERESKRGNVGDQISHATSIVMNTILDPFKK
jgi:low affinity Fe/Cu permease